MSWLKTLIHMAEREKGSQIRGEALSLLLKLTRGEEAELRAWSLSLLGEMEGATAPGSEPVHLLERAMDDPKARPEERALAAWSLRKTLKGNPALTERMVKLAEHFQRLPERDFKFMAQTHCIGQVAGALSFALNVELGPDTSKWRQALAGFLPPKK